jgi:hypothetical protein
MTQPTELERQWAVMLAVIKRAAPLLKSLAKK